MNRWSGKYLGEVHLAAYQMGSDGCWIVLARLAGVQGKPLSEKLMDHIVSRMQSQMGHPSDRIGNSIVLEDFITKYSAGCCLSQVHYHRILGRDVKILEFRWKNSCLFA